MTGISISFDATSGVAYMSWNNVVWNPASFTARCALIYDQTAANGSIAVIDFGADKSCSNTFTVTMPANAYNTALIRSA